MPEEVSPKVAVQIPAWNQAEELVDCLNSLKEVDYKNLEVVVVNNGEDNTSEIVRRDFPWVTLIEDGIDLGFCRANNIGFRYCLEKQVDYILLLNGDTKVFPDTISTLLKVMQGDPSIAIAGAKNLLMENPHYTWGKYGEVKWSPMLVTTAGRFEPDSTQKQPPSDVDWVICNGCLIRAHVLEKIGLFDEDYWMCNEDVEWSYRARENGYRTVYVDEAAILHKGSSSTNLKNKKKVFSYGYFLGRNPFIFARKYGKKHQIVRLFFNVYLGMFIRILCQLYKLTEATITEIYRSVRGITIAYIRNIHPVLASEKVISKGVKRGMKGVNSPEFLYMEMPHSPQPPVSTPAAAPLILRDGGPLKTKANTVFNEQPDGSAAMWLIAENAGERTQVKFGGKKIKPIVHNSQTLTLRVPRKLYSKPGLYEIHIFNPQEGEKSNSLFFTVD